MKSTQGSEEYRRAKALDVTLLDLCTTNIEERLYSQGFSILSSALTSGTNSSLPAQIPPTQHLALAATLVVHPKFTTRTLSPDKHLAADDALRYLRDINSIVGPRNAHLDEAFRFTADPSSSRGQRAKTRLTEILDVDTTNDNEDNGTPGHIYSSYAHASSLWRNAEDFWAVLGWALNCSVAHPARWRRWHLLLDFLLDVLEDDLEARVAEARAAFASGGSGAVQAVLKTCLFTLYLSPIGQGRNNKRRLMRAVFANASPKSLAEFGEVWKNETKPPKQEDDEPLGKRRKLDLENGDYGDYLDDSDEESPGSSIRRSRSVTAAPGGRRSGPATDVEDESGHESSGAITPGRSSALPGVEAFGGMEAIRLRQRILALLTAYCSLNPDEFLDNEDLFDLYTEFIRPLPLPVFQQFALPMKPYLSVVGQASLNQMLLRPLLAATAPPYQDVVLKQADLETHYAPHAANNASAMDNAKVSLVVESLLRILWNSATLEPTLQLQNLVRQGIAARKEKVAFDGRRKVNMRARADEEAIVVLNCSSERMLMILNISD